LPVFYKTHDRAPIPILCPIIKLPCKSFRTSSIVVSIWFTRRTQEQKDKSLIEFGKTPMPRFLSLLVKFLYTIWVRKINDLDPIFSLKALVFSKRI